VPPNPRPARGRTICASAVTSVSSFASSHRFAGGGSVARLRARVTSAFPNKSAVVSVACAESASLKKRIAVRGDESRLAATVSLDAAWPSERAYCATLVRTSPFSSPRVSVASTKIQRPRLRPGLTMPRPALERQLLQALGEQPLVLLCAPAGCGVVADYVAAGSWCFRRLEQRVGGIVEPPRITELVSIEFF